MPLFLSLFTDFSITLWAVVNEMEVHTLKSLSKKVFTVSLLTLFFWLTACSSDTAQSSSSTPEQVSEIRGVVSSVAGNEVTIDVISSEEVDRSQTQEGYKLTGESKIIQISDGVPLVVIARSEEGVTETSINISSIATGDVLSVQYASDGTIEKIRVIPQ